MTVQVVFSVLASVIICLLAYKKRALNVGGIIAAFPMGVSCVLSGARFTAVLLGFFISCSFITAKVGVKAKLAISDPGYAEHKKKGGRTCWQVLASGLVCTVMAAFHVAHVGSWSDSATLLSSPDFKGQWSWPLIFQSPDTLSTPVMHTGIYIAFVGTLAFCTADTWASEIGVTSKAKPRLITTWRVVPPGTNGGVTLLGTLAGACAGLVIGLFGAFSYDAGGVTFQGSIVALGIAAGVVGSAIDSLIGATLQYSGRDKKTGAIVSDSAPPKNNKNIESVGARFAVLSNTQVNLVTSIIVCLISPSLYCFITGIF